MFPQYNIITYDEALKWCLSNQEYTNIDYNFFPSIPPFLTSFPQLLNVMIHGGNLLCTALGNVTVNGQTGETQDPQPIYSIQIKMCYPFLMEKCPRNIAVKIFFRTIVFV